MGVVPSAVSARDTVEPAPSEVAVRDVVASAATAVPFHRLPVLMPSMAELKAVISVLMSVVWLDENVPLVFCTVSS